ncbi:hypothetical protein TWF281_004716 [Arthrobotrys megalospora]
MDPRRTIMDHGFTPSRTTPGNPFGPPPPPGIIPLWRQKLYSPSSTPPPPHTPTPDEIAYRNNKFDYPRGHPEPHFDPVKPTSIIVYKYIKDRIWKPPGAFPEPNPEDASEDGKKKEEQEGDKKKEEQEETIMEALRKGMQRVRLGGEPSNQVEPEIEINTGDYTIPLDGLHREFARNLMLKMLSKGIGAMHKDRIQRVNDMINDCMLTPWDEIVGITLWNLSRTNPFVHQNPRTRYLDGLFRGFRKMWIEICTLNQGEIDFGEAVCRYLYRSRSQVATMDLELLHFYAQTFFLTSHGFWLYQYRLFRESIGKPLGAHCEHTLMDREKTPKMLVDYTLILMNNRNFESDNEDIEIPIQVIDAAGACVKTLSQEYKNEESNEHNKALIEHFARNVFSASRQKLLHYCRMSSRSLAFDDVV